MSQLTHGSDVLHTEVRTATRFLKFHMFHQVKKYVRFHALSLAFIPPAATSVRRLHG